ncbi:unnamed protein product [Protopolystoma xenopodis]|uniref:Uncharacterized protein n=1 Tax=Protopolystoma xenopodis TaxID=117903 RepID=A0A448XEX9_9PLAT|nr:unnamed protein product [Protopolystoma xenopodis]
MRRFRPSVLLATVRKISVVVEMKKAQQVPRRVFGHRR